MSGFATKTPGTWLRRDAASGQRPNVGVLVVLLCLVSLSTNTLAQVAASGASKATMPEPIRLALKREPYAKQGTVAAVEGAVDENGQRLLVEGLDILQPVGVILLAKDRSDQIHLQLAKFGDKTPLRELTTDSEGRAVARLRTQGDLVLVVQSTSQKPVTFGLVVWAGDEQKAEMKDVVVPLGKS